MKVDKVTLTPTGGELVTGTYTKKFDMEACLKQVGTVDQTPLGLMPPAVRWISSDRRRWIVEKPPVMMPITYLPTDKYTAGQTKNRELIHIPVPWQTYVVSIGAYANIKVLVSNTQIRSPKHELCYMPLPNVDMSGEVCIPAPMYSEFPQWVKDKKPTLSEQVMWVINCFWMSGFNNNMHTTAMGPAEWKNMSLSAFMDKLTKTSLDEILTLTWRKSTTLDRLMVENNYAGTSAYQQMANAAWRSLTE